jgi:uncharacterized protein with GYD domain
MATYILLLTLTQEGREQMLEDPDCLLRAEAEARTPEMEVLGVYGVLGEYDFVSIIEAPDNDSIARFSLALGAKAGAHITTLPAVPISRFNSMGPRHRDREPAGVGLELPDWLSEEDDGGESGPTEESRPV